MQKEDFYVFSNGILYKKYNNLVFQNEEELVEWPIHKIHSIRIYGNVTITTKLLKYLMNLGIDVFFYTKLGVYLGHTTSLHNKANFQYLQAQMKAFFSNRVHIAKNFMLGSLASMLYTIKTLNYSRLYFDKIKEIFLECITKNFNSDIASIRECEARAWKYYYRYLSSSFQYFKFFKRSYKPPEDEFNALVSFINSLLYGTINALIRESFLNELISYLHEPYEKRSSLVFDFADIFKPYFLYRLMYFADSNFYESKHFKKKSKGVYLEIELRKALTFKYASILNEIKQNLFGLSKNASIRSYLKSEILRFRNSLVIEDGIHYTYFLNWWIKSQKVV